MKPQAWGSWTTETPLRALYGLLALVGVALLGCLAWVLAATLAPDTPQPFRQMLTQALECVQPAQPVPLRREALARLLQAATPAPADPCWHPVALPRTTTDAMGHDDRAKAGVATAWYRVRVAVPANWPAHTAGMLMAPRVSARVWQVRVNGQPVADNIEDWRMIWNRPLVAAVPESSIVPGQPLDLVIALPHSPGGSRQLARLRWGTPDELKSELMWREALHHTLPQVSSLVLLILGAFFFMFWLTRRTEKTHLLLAAASVAWAVSNLQYALPRNDDPAIDAWYNGIVLGAIPWYMWLLALFTLQFSPRRIRWVQWLMPLAVLVMSAMAVPQIGAMDDEGMVYLVVLSGMSFGVTLLIGWLAWSGDSADLRLLAVAMALAAACSVHDVGLVSGWVNPESVYLLPFSGVLIFGASLYALQRRYARSIDAHEALAASLQEQIRAHEVRWHASHERLRQLERAEALADERARMTRDIHDGLGAMLTTSLVASEAGQLDQTQMAGLLRDCMDELRTIIESLGSEDDDLVSVLASLRFRMESRLKHAGLALNWAVQDVPPLTWMTPQDLMHVVRIVQEALVNTLKHARATQIAIATEFDGEAVIVRYRDNGIGFAPVQGRGRGLRNLQQRCDAMGIRYALQAAPGAGCELTLTLPVVRSLG